MTRSEPAELRFWKYVTYCPNTGCWLWTGATTPHGYGKIAIGGTKQIIASRLSFIMHHGDPDDLSVCHRCDVPACVNPNHLFAGTHTDNMRDCSEKKRFTRKGSRNGRALLTEQDVFEIRKSSLRHVDIAKLYGVSPQVILMCRQRQTWRHVP